MQEVLDQNVKVQTHYIKKNVENAQTFRNLIKSNNHEINLPLHRGETSITGTEFMIRD